MRKASVISPANIAFVKHWGLSSEGLPLTGSLSMNLDSCFTHSTVEFLPDQIRDEIWMERDRDFVLLELDSGRNHAAYSLIERFRQAFGISNFAKIYTKNSFPADAGIASSASGFSTLAVALLATLPEESEAEKIKWIASAASFSALRSLADGFGFLDQNLSVKSLKTSLNLVDLVVGISHDKKLHTSLQGHQLATTSPLQSARLEQTARNLSDCEEALMRGDFLNLIRIIEEETLLLHAVMLTSQPALIYWEPLTLELLKLSQIWKQEIPFAFSLDAGSTVHLIVEESNLEALKARVDAWGKAIFLLEARPCEGAHFTNQHLF